MSDAPEWLEAYQGGDIIGYAMRNGIRLPDESDCIKSITQVRDFAIIVTELAVYKLYPYHHIGVALTLMVYT